MPITRRRRANPPEEPENTPSLAEENVQEVSATEQASTTLGEAEQSPPSGDHTDTISSQPSGTPPTSSQPASQASIAQVAPVHGINGERPERQEYTPSIEGGRRTSRGELFRRPPQMPLQQPAPSPVLQTQQLQAPTHEISLPLGNLLHLAYNPGYTGSDEARSALLHQLAQESKNGGRARCWNCGSLAIRYDRWNTRSKTFGEIGVALCEICGVWSVM